ncbi:MAG: hypothetical protein HON68_01730 [Gammaproteobacteria bacterium]|jgi:hypothetical protein|nr:hypothetical protein [Gammaproteobacteria bacterium]MBT3718699.1 hypothetical protein [Gammaproteobacteria bacterium]MBT3845701.1 hypothetical protein [Gammaproteobacteria bacterium]MBT3891906.1 hypothetical protein [Gammaproteobacteria bacterium]MBT4787833.1 hypothetical protein [Gammaproteobacteria bacterium]
MKSEELKAFLENWLAEIDEFSLKSLHHRLVQHGVCGPNVKRREISAILMRLEDEDILSIVRIDDIDEENPFKDPLWTAFQND